MTSIDPAVQSVLNAKQNAVKSELAYAVTAKSLSATKQQGEAAVQLVESAAQLGRAVGKGGHFDRQG